MKFSFVIIMFLCCVFNFKILAMHNQNKASDKIIKQQQTERQLAMIRAQLHFAKQNNARMHVNPHYQLPLSLEADIRLHNQQVDQLLLPNQNKK